MRLCVRLIPVALLSATALSSAAIAGNAFTITQVGNGNASTTVQTGSNAAVVDQVGNSLSASGIQNGSSNNFHVIQREHSNAAATNTAGAGNNVSVRQTGQQNVAASVVHGTGNRVVQLQDYHPTWNSPMNRAVRNTSNAHVTGSYNDLTTEQYGPDNVVNYRQDGDGQVGRTVQIGDPQIIAVNQQGAAQRVDITQIGYDNVVDAAQRGVGNLLITEQHGYRNHITTNVNGSGNNTSQTQEETDNTIINSVTGNNNTTRQAQIVHPGWASHMNKPVRNFSHAVVTGSGNYLVTGQYGPENRINYTQTGDNNYGFTQQIGDPQILSIVQQGVGQQLTSTQIGYDNVANIRQIGLYNTLSTNQHGTANRADITADGDFLTVRLRQDFLEGWASPMNYAQNNYAYIYSNGIHNTALVSQHGPLNQAYLTQEGVHNLAKMTQIGDPQFLSVRQWEVAYSTVDAQQTGYDNVATLDQEGYAGAIGVSNTNYVRQLGFNNGANTVTRGSHNFIGIQQDGHFWNDVGHYNYTDVHVSGDSNSVSVAQVLWWNDARINMVGNGNTFGIGQERGPNMGATKGNVLNANVFGTGNYFSGYQWGSNDFSINQVGNYNAALMEQKNDGNWANRNTGIIAQTGNNNAAQLFQVAVPHTVVPNQAPGQGPVNGDVGIIEQYGDGNNAVVWQASDNSFSRILQVGNANSYWSQQNGNSNILNIEQHGNGLAFAVTQGGVGQVMSIAQYR